MIKFFLFIALSLIILTLSQGCKDNTVTQEPETNVNSSNAPVLLSPGNGTTIGSLTPQLDWEDFPSASGYVLMVSMDANFASAPVLDTAGILSSQFSIPESTFSTNTFYYWRVRALTSAGPTPWSSAWRFNIILSPPDPPSLIFPQNGSAGQSFTPLFDWSTVPNAQLYRIQVSQSVNFTNLLLDSGRINISQLLCPPMILNTSTRYYWRANASNSNGVSTSPWSEVFNFTTIAGPPPNSISGTVTFADTLFVQFPEYYMAGVYSSWPPSGNQPDGTDSLAITRVGQTYKASYRVTMLNNGSYYVCVITGTFLPNYAVMGIYGCDTAHVKYSQCPNNPPRVDIINNSGVENVNFISWADTTRRIF